ncbi:MAG: hypothetical protein JSU96_04505, partial [Acidobacteriota bacterium]
FMISRHRNCLAAVRSGDDLVRTDLKCDANQFSDFRLIINDQYLLAAQISSYPCDRAPITLKFASDYHLCPLGVLVSIPPICYGRLLNTFEDFSYDIT